MADEDMADDDVSRLLDAATAAARRPSARQRAVSPESSDEVAELLAKAQDLSRPTTPVTKSPRATRPEPTVAAGSRPKGLIAVIAIVAVALIAIGAYAMGQSAAPPAQTASANAATADAPVDPAQVAGLMEKIAASPTDTDSLRSLGNLYYGANDFTNALTFYEKVAVIAPKDDQSWIPVAAAAFQGGKESRAFEAWNIALGINPDNIEAHYGLGHYYLSQTPPDEAKARVFFEKVIALDPKSEQAKEVQIDLANMKAGSASATPAN